ncbi:MAG: pyridine nucleotide-disulfide oxidoreductase [Pseudopedobacter saltans]|uniref:Pyridine nucleotide-disulfide oxidoreductase n=1 Tax=Pseudopedobacter saltans TaxID=151895 RepID=A0A2W5GSI9_9SPHI|nr:MAG: pyridine nucleotide-disulfide oxidoreductase [Pseudopedobacter saltans]
MSTNNFEAIIIGGSYAGLSAAMALGRSLRKVLILDTNKPCNRQTPHSHNFITHDGDTPAEISKQALQQVLKYPTIFYKNEEAIYATQKEFGFEIGTNLDKIYTTKKVIIASGIKDIMPDIIGFSECWGISVIHCPYCHGYEVKGLKTGIIANGDRGFHMASLINNLTADITLLTNEKANFTPEQLSKLENHNISIVDKEIIEIEHKNGYVDSVIFSDGSKMDFKAAYAAIPFTQNSNIPLELGCAFTETGHIKVDASFKTNIPGIFACGDCASMARTVANAVGSGNLTGAMVNLELTMENF